MPFFITFTSFYVCVDTDTWERIQWDTSSW